MRFASPQYFLLIIPAVLFFVLFLIGKIGRQPALRFSSVDMVKKAGGRKVVWTRLLQAILRLAVLTLLILALARPQTGTGEDKSTQKVIDIVIALDVSGSMATMDFNPDNRLTAAKIEAKKFVEARKDDRIGFVIFAGQSITQCPMTVDHKAVLALIDKVEMGMLEDGTAIGLGLANAVNRLKNSDAKSKIVVLLTDGVNNAGEIDPQTASNLALQFKIKVYTIGVGKEGTSYLPVQDRSSQTRLIQVETQIDEKMLNAISKKTGGLYFRAQDEKGLREVFKEIDRLEKTEVQVEHFTHYEEHFLLFLWPALFVLLAELVWTNVLFVKIP